MQVATGLLEGTEQILAGQVNKTAGTRCGKGESSVEKAEAGEFQTLLKKVSETSEEEEENSPEITDPLRAQLLLLFPQLTSINVGGETNSVAEAIAEKGQLLSGVISLTTETGEAVPSLAEVLGNLPQSSTEEGEVNSVEGTSIFPPTTAMPENPGQQPVFLNNHGDAADSDGSLPVEAGGIDGRERTEGLLSMLEEITEATQTSLKEKAGQHRQPSLTADGGRSFGQLIDDEKQAHPATKTGANDDKTDAKLVLEKLIASEDLQPDAEVVGEIPRSNARPGKEAGKPVFHLVDGGSSTTQSAEEIADANSKATETPEIGRAELATQIISKAKLMVKNGLTKLQIQLEPAELGKLELSLVVERDLVAARFVTESQGVQSLIEANLPQLRTSLEEAGLRVDLLQVGVQSGTNSPLQQETTTGGEQFKRYSGWAPSAELYSAEEAVFADEEWHGMVNLRV